MSKTLFYKRKCKRTLVISHRVDGNRGSFHLFSFIGNLPKWGCSVYARRLHVIRKGNAAAFWGRSCYATGVPGALDSVFILTVFEYTNYTNDYINSIYF